MELNSCQCFKDLFSSFLMCLTSAKPAYKDGHAFICVSPSLHWSQGTVWPPSREMHNLFSSNNYKLTGWVWDQSWHPKKAAAGLMVAVHLLPMTFFKRQNYVKSALSSKILHFAYLYLTWKLLQVSDSHPHKTTQNIQISLNYLDPVLLKIMASINQYLFLFWILRFKSRFIGGVQLTLLQLIELQCSAIN